MISLSALLFLAPIDVFPADNLKNVLDNLQAGDEAILHEGTYPPMGFTAFSWQGTAQDPIIVRAADGEAVVIQGQNDQNTMNITGSYYQIRDLEIAGGSHGLRLETSDHVILENLEIHAVQDVGISCNRPGMTYENITVRGLEIYDTGLNPQAPGECMYLGCNDNACQMWDSVIEWNYCHDTGGNQGDGIEVKTGSYNNIVRHNVIHDVNYPAITMYGTVDNKAPNQVWGNVIWNVVDNGIQTVGDVNVLNNIVFNVGANGIHAKPSQGEVVENAMFAHNTIINPGGVCFRGNAFPGNSGIVMANNAFYCEGGDAIRFADGQGSAMLAANAVLGSLVGVNDGTFDGGSLAAAFVDAASMDVYPADGSVLIGAADGLVIADEDFNCLTRQAPHDVGAYGYPQSGNPGWTIQEAFKECDTGGGGTTGGGSTGGGTTDGGTSGGSTGGSASDSDTASTGGSATASGTATSGTATATSGGSATTGATDGGTDGGTGGMDDGSGCSCRADAGGTGIVALFFLAPLGLRRRRTRTASA